MVLAVGGAAQAAVTIDGTIGAGEWAGAATYTIQGGGTAYLKADTNFIYGAFDITGWTTAMGSASGGNLLGFGVWKVNLKAAASDGVEFQQATDKATWGGDGPSGTMNGLASAFRINSVLQASIPANLQAMDSFDTGHRVWEVKMPIATMGVKAGDEIYAVGGINYDKKTHWYPGNLVWASYAPVVVQAVPEPATMTLLALGGIATLIRRRRRA
jgi:PEP-CTERM motif